MTASSNLRSLLAVDAVTEGRVDDHGDRVGRVVLDEARARLRRAGPGWRGAALGGDVGSVDDDVRDLHGGAFNQTASQSGGGRLPVRCSTVTDTSAEVTDLLQHLIRNACVNDGTAGRGARRAASTVRSATSTARARHRALRARARAGQPGRCASRAPTRRADPAADGPHRRRARERGPLAARPLRWRARRRRGVGPRRRRHAEPHRVDGRRHAPPGATRASGPTARSCTWPSPTRRRWAPGAPTTWSSHEPTRCVADYVITESGGIPVAAVRRHRSCRSSSARRAAAGARCGSGHARPRVAAVPDRQRPGQSGRGRATASPSSARRPRSTTCGAASSAAWTSRASSPRPLLDPDRLDAALGRPCRWAWPGSSTPARTPRSPRPSCTAAPRPTSSPTASTSQLDIRTLPGQAADDVAGHARRGARRPRRPRRDRRGARRPVHRVADRHAAVGQRSAAWPGPSTPAATLVPMLTVGATDARFFRRLGHDRPTASACSAGSSRSTTSAACSTATTSASTSSRCACPPSCGRRSPATCCAADVEWTSS